MKPEIYCPRCGVKLVRRGAALYCPDGEMELTARLESMLVLLVAGTPNGPVDPGECGMASARWRCPRCATRMTMTSAPEIEMLCTACGVRLSPSMVHRLLDRHPHRSTPRKPDPGEDDNPGNGGENR